MQSTGNPIETALRIIDNFCKEEYMTSIWEGPVDLGNIGILYTTFGDDDEHVLQVYVDLRKHEIRYEADDGLVLVDHYECVGDMNVDLDEMTYQSLFSDGVGAYRRRHPEYERDEMEELERALLAADHYRDWLREQVCGGEAAAACAVDPYYNQGVF